MASVSNVPPPSEINARMSMGTSLVDLPLRPTIVTDWRSEVIGETHKGSFVWDEQIIAKEHGIGNCDCSHVFRCRGKKAILTGSRVNLPKNISLIGFFRQRLTKFNILPDNDALKFGFNETETLSFNELDLVSNGVANALLSKLGSDCKNTNLDNDIIIAACCPQSVQYIALIFAILKMGAGIFPISTDVPVERILNSLNEVRPILTVITKDCGDLYKALTNPSGSDPAVPYAILDDIWVDLDDQNNVSSNFRTVEYIKKLPSEPNKVYPPLFERTVAVISPSSSTGTFNCIRYKSRSIFNWLMWEWLYFPLSKSEVMIIESEIDTITSLLEILSPLLHGNCLIVLEPKKIKHPLVLLQKIEDFNISRLSVWPSLLHSILNTLQLIDIKEGRRMLASMKYWFCIGGVLNLEEANLFFSLLSYANPMLINMYENDENVGVLCYQVLDNTKQVERLNYHGRLPLGSPIPNCRIYVVDEKMKIVRGQEVGEICVAVAKEYCTTNGPQKETILNPFNNSADYKYLLKTGDYGRVVTGQFGKRHLVYENSSRSFERHVFIDSRIVQLDEIELHVKNLKEYVKDCYVLCHRAGFQDQIVIAFCCVKKGAKTLDKIRVALMTKLPTYMIPDLIEMDEIPRYESGEINENYLLRYHYEESIRRQDFHDWASLDDFSRAELHAVKVLFQVIFLMLGAPIQSIAENYNKPFFNIPRTTVSKLVFVVYELHRNRYPITLDEFINAKSLSEIVSQMVITKDIRELLISDPDALTIENTFVVEVLKDEHKIEVVALLCFGLTNQGSLDYYSDVKRSDLRKFLIYMWVLFVTKGLSIFVRRVSDKKIVGVSINVNWHDEIAASKSLPLTPQIAYRLQLMQILENGFAQTKMSPTKSSVVQVCYALLDSRELNPIDTHALMEKMMAATIDRAISFRFDAIIYTTFDYFVTDICVNTFGFNVIRECRLNQFIAADSRRPYHLAPDNIIASLCWKKLI